MAYTETTYKSWFTRLKESVGGIIFGFLLIAGGTYLLWWNEGDTFKTAGAIAEAELQTQEADDITKLDPALEGKLIHAWAFADTEDILKDDLFGIQAKAVKLSRNVEFYQWEESSETETRKKLGGGEETVTTYNYKTEWTSDQVDSNSFHDPAYRGKNFSLASIKDQDILASNVKFGAYVLPDFLVRKIGGEVPMTITEIDKKAVQNIIQIPAEYNASKTSGDIDLIHVSGAMIYIGLEPSKPRVGDVRITFEQTPPAEVSIIAQVMKNTFENFRASNGYTFNRLEMGKVSMSEMFDDARKENTFMAWVFRILGAVLIIFGLDIVFSPLSVVFDVIPILGDIVGAGAGLFAFIFGLAWSLIVIAVAWLRYRPLIAGGMIAAALALIFLLRAKGKNK